MNNKCLHLKLRTKKGKRYFYCSRKRTTIEISDCHVCINCFGILIKFFSKLA